MVQSAAGLLSLLDEPELDLKIYSLNQLNLLVNTFWAEIADELVKIEALSESQTFPSRTLASLLASKIYYHLGNLDESLNFALGAENLFDLSNKQGSVVDDNEVEYVETVIAKAIDTYVALRSSNSNNAEEVKIDPRLELIVERMFERCERDGEFKQALGISLSSHRLDILERIFNQTKDVKLLEWTLNIVIREGVIGGSSRSYKNEVILLLIKLFTSLPSPDYFSITQCFVYLSDPNLASHLLSTLLSLDTPDEVVVEEEKILIAYQIAFDLAETATQEFLEVVRKNLSSVTSVAPVPVVEGAVVEAKKGKELCRERIVAILTGEESIKLYLEFLYKNNQSDLLILTGTKEALEPRNSIYHSAITFMNAFASAGTTSELFLRSNLDWLSLASNWSKFSATAALGVIHKGNLEQGKAILAPYLPASNDSGAGGGGVGSSVFSEGGSLYALGLVHSNHGSEEILNYLKEALKVGGNEVIQHGAALGLGVAGMGGGNEEMYEELRNTLFNDSAIAGESAGYAMGLIMLGSGSIKCLDEMLQYAHETQHEKIIRGLAVGISFLFYGKEEEADETIEKLLGDADAILRYGGVHTIAMAYAGTSNNSAIKKLLHVAVSDVNDDVRRAAVTSLGFILFRNYKMVPRVVQLLSESYNPNVRYGAAMALGISCAGTGLEDAIALLEPLTKDPVDFVRQGACVSLAMILIQQNEQTNPKVTTIRAIFSKIIKDKHEDGMAKFGAALSQGIIDAGGRNVTISLTGKGGAGNNMPAIVGMCMFTQFWYWFPLSHMLSLSFTPTAIIGVDKDLKIPKFDFISNAKPSLFAYPPATVPPTKEVVEKVTTAVLSTTAKATARAKAKEVEAAAEGGEGDGMDTDEKPVVVASTSTEDTEMKSEEPATDSTPAATTTTPKPKRKSEPTSDKLSNLSRVTPGQLNFISFPSDARYVPVRSTLSSSSHSTSTSTDSTSSHNKLGGSGGGILLMRDREPEKEGEFLEMEVIKVLDLTTPEVAAVPAGGATGGDGIVDEDDLTGPIAPPPASFEWTDWE